ncbi:MAG: hypothetical protein WCO71_11005 [Pseudomonadota bacterium]
MRPTLGLYLILIGILEFYLNGCRTAAPQATVDDFQLDDQEDQEEGSASASSQSPKNESKLTMDHPKEPTAWFTRRLLMTTPQPAATRINECHEKIDATVKDAPNLRALDEVSLTLESVVTQSPNLYHWCFYQIMADLDLRLNTDSPLMQDKADLFMSRMKSLWGLGRALDTGLGTTVYMSYLRTRYTEINQNIFGRNLETVDVNSFRMPTSGAGKAAAEYDAH